MKDIIHQINETVEYIHSQTNHFHPLTGIVLGSGLGGLVKEIDVKHTISYENIPYFPLSTVEGHSGKLIFGFLSGKPVVAMQGRFHFYEGYDIQKVVYPIRVMKYLGIEQLFLSNAAGGVNPEMEIGDIMIINDHINLLPTNPLIGRNIPEFGPRFPDMSDAYHQPTIDKAIEISKEAGYKILQGVYIAMSGPTFETPAEYRYVRIIGGDAVGMSTVPEVIIARHMGIPCFGISVITDLGVPGKIVEVTHEDVIKAASKAETKMTHIFKRLLD